MRECVFVFNVQFVLLLFDLKKKEEEIIININLCPLKSSVSECISGTGKSQVAGTYNIPAYVFGMPIVAYNANIINEFPNKCTLNPEMTMKTKHQSIGFIQSILWIVLRR